MKAYSSTLLVGLWACEGSKPVDSSGDTSCSGPEINCDGVDNDCDDLTDEDQLFGGWFVDADEDGYGDAGTEVGSCDLEDGVTYVEDATDCDDSDADRHPGQLELDVCGDGVDTDCVGGEGEEGDACALQGTVALTRLNAEEYVGTVAVALGDVDDDGLMDFAVGNPSSDTVTIYTVGGATTVDVAGTSGSGFGTALAAGNFDGDEAGVVDLAVGAPAESHEDGSSGAAVILVGPSWAKGRTIEPSSDYTELGAALATLPEGGADGLAVAQTDESEDDSLRYVRVHTAPNDASTDTTTRLGAYATDASWPLSLASDAGGTGLVVGHSGDDGTCFQGAAFRKIEDGAIGSGLTFCAAKSDDLGLLGASVFLVGPADTGLLLLGGPEGNGNVYGIVAPSASTLDVPSDATLHWTGPADSQAGASIALSADIDGDGDDELAIGGDGLLWLVYQGAGGVLADGALNSTATAKVTGFTGLVRSIVGPGDVNGDGYGDLLVSDSADTYLLYGGPAQAVTQ